MILDEAIAHAKEIANTKYAEGLSMLCHANPSDEELDGCIECAREHKQLAEWLTELQRYKQIGTVKECQEAMTKQSVVYCKECEFYSRGKREGMEDRRIERPPVMAVPGGRDV